MGLTVDVEIIGGFDYKSLQVEQRVLVQQCASEISKLLRQQLYNVVEVGQKLLEVKQALKSDGLYRQWIESEFPWEKSSANRFEHVALQFANVPNWAMLGERFDLSALYILSAPSTPDAVRQKAIALATSGERVSHARAKALRAGIDAPTLKAGETYTVADSDSPFYGQAVTVTSVDKKDGMVACTTPQGGVASLLIGELVVEVPTAPKPAPKPAPNHMGAMSAELDVERERVQLLEAMLRRLVDAARSGKLSDKLIREAESLI